MSKTKTTNSKPVSLRIPPKLQRDVARGAKRTGLTKAAFYRFSIQMGIDPLIAKLEATQ